MPKFDLFCLLSAHPKLTIKFPNFCWLHKIQSLFFTLSSSQDDYKIPSFLWLHKIPSFFVPAQNSTCVINFVLLSLLRLSNSLSAGASEFYIIIFFSHAQTFWEKHKVNNTGPIFCRHKKRRNFVQAQKWRNFVQAQKTKEFCNHLQRSSKWKIEIITDLKNDYKTKMKTLLSQDTIIKQERSATMGGGHIFWQGIHNSMKDGVAEINVLLVPLCCCVTHMHDLAE